MAKNGVRDGEGNVTVITSQTLTSSSAPPRPLSRSADPLLLVCRCFSFVVAVSGILCIAVNVLAAVSSFRNGYDVFDGIFRCYAVVIAIIVVIAETEWGFIIKFWKVLDYWVGRGMLQIFVAVMTKAYADNSASQEHLILLQNIASYMLLACGLVYIISGVLCIGFLKRSRQEKEVSRAQAVKDLEELERRKEELEQLLLAERV